jgi:site-specific DNA recombinase
MATGVLCGGATTRGRRSSPGTSRIVVDFNLDKASGRKELRDDTSEAEYESEHRGERVAIARKRQARQGVYGGGGRPYGWGVDAGRVRSVCVNPKAPPMERVWHDQPVLDMTRHNQQEAEEIRHWASELLAGVSMAQLLRDLAARKVATVAMKDGRSLRKNGKPVTHQGWNSRTLQQILTNPRTSGHAVYQGEIVKRNAYPPILEDDIRLALITLFADPSRKTSPGNTPRWLGSLIYQCGVCADGTTMSVRYDPRGNPTYRCRAKGHCLWPARAADRYVENVIVARLSRPDVVDLIPREQEVDVTGLRDELLVLDARKRDAAQRFALGTIDGAQLDTITATIDKRISQIRADLSSATSESPLSEFAMSQDAQRTWEDLSLGRKRETLRQLFTVRLAPIGRGRRYSHDLIHIGPVSPVGSRAALSVFS